MPRVAAMMASVRPVERNASETSKVRLRFSEVTEELSMQTPTLSGFGWSWNLMAFLFFQSLFFVTFFNDFLQWETCEGMIHYDIPKMCRGTISTLWNGQWKTGKWVKRTSKEIKQLCGSKITWFTSTTAMRLIPGLTGTCWSERRQTGREWWKIRWAMKKGLLGWLFDIRDLIILQVPSYMGIICHKPWNFIRIPSFNKQYDSWNP